MEIYRKKLIATIKIAQKQLNLDDSTYRAVLIRTTNKRSCTEMTQGQLRAVLKEMKRLGFESVSKHKRPPIRPAASNMLAKVEALLADNNLPWSYAHAVAKRMFHVDRVQWLSNQNLHKLIAALQIHADRKGNAHADS